MKKIKSKVGILGAFAYSGANFILSFMLQAVIPAGDFGLYAFALVFLQFGISLSNALFASPIVVSLASEEVDRSILIGSYFKANIVFISLASALLLVTLFLLGMAPTLIGIVLIQAIGLWLRWFFRSVELAEHRFAMAAMADVIYGIVTLSTGIALFLLTGVNEFNALSAMAAGAMASTLMIGGDTVRTILGRTSSTLRLYWKDFMQHSRWALLGVVTTEITANFHIYVLTLFLGPAAFAPVATVSLFFRPIPILMQAITQFERPVLARAFKAGDLQQVHNNVNNIHKIITMAVIINTLMVVILLEYFPLFIGGGQYADALLWPIVFLLAFGQVVRGLRTGSSAALQGVGCYKPLAFVTVKAAPITMLGTVLALIFNFEVIALVLFSVLIGEFATFIMIRKIYRITFV